jgi:Spy/CpxP family protein refolding chaperone
MLPPGRWWKNAEVVKAVGLSDGQVQKIEQVFHDSRLKLVDVHANLEKEELKLEPLLEAETPDEGAVLAAIDRITAAHASVEKANAQMAFAIRRVLSPEQWKKLRALPHHDHFPPPMEGPHDNFRRPHSEPRGQGNPPEPPAPDSAPEPNK